MPRGQRAVEGGSLGSRPLPAFVLTALLLPLAPPAHAEDPLPRPSGLSPADLFTVQPSRPLEGFTSTRPEPSTPLFAGPVPSDFLQTAISQELRALVIHAGLFQTVPDLFSRPVSPQEAQRLLAVVLGAEATWRNLGPRKVLCRLLAEIAASPKGLGLSALGRILASYRHVLIVRGDGYFARVLDGEAIQRAGHVEFDPALGELRASTYGVGALYLNNQGGLYGLDEETRRTLGLSGELSLEHGLGPIDNVLDGVEDSLGGMVRGLGELIREPVRTIEGLEHLPEGVIALVRSSPEYWERFKEMPQGDQIREVSRLVTELVLLKGSVKGVIAGGKGMRAAYVLGKQALDEAAQAAAKGMAAGALGAGRRGSVLVLIPTLTADGRLIWEAIAVPVEQLAEAGKLGLGAGGELGASGSFILQMGAEQGGQGGSGRSGDDNGKGIGTREKARGQADEGGAEEGNPEQWVPDDNWQGPTDGEWLGATGNSRFKPQHPEKLGLKPGDAIEFHRGRPDFSPWSQGEFDVPEMNGDHSFDIRLIKQRLSQQKGWFKADGSPNASAAERWLQQQGLSPHHAGGTKVQLIPRKLHRGISHTGGAFELRNLNRGE